MDFIIYVIGVLTCLFVGAFDIKKAVEYFKDKSYGWFGWSIMLAIWMIAMLLAIVFKRFA